MKYLLHILLWGSLLLQMACKDNRSFSEEVTGFEKLQKEKPPLQPDTTLFFKNYGVQEGLISSELHHVYADQSGYIWIASSKGVMRFDGKSITPFYAAKGGNSLLGASFFYEDQQANLWVLSGDGFLSRFDSQLNQFASVKTTLENGWSDERPLFIEAQNDNELWFGGYGGLQTYDLKSDSARVFPIEKIRTMDWPHAEKVRIERFIKDKDQQIWVGTRKFGLARFDPGTGEYNFLRDRPEFKNYLLDDWITDIVSDEIGNFWISDFERGLVHFDPHSQEILDFIELEKLIGSPYKVAVRDILKEGQYLWLATNYHGLLLFDTHSQKVIKHFDKSNSDVPFNKIKAITRDHLGNYWLTGDHLASASSLFYEFTTKALGDQLSVYRLSAASDGVIASTQKGLYALSEKGLVKKIAADDERYLGVLESSDGTIWAGQPFNLVAYDQRFSVRQKIPYSLILDSLGNSFRQAHYLYEDSKGLIWSIDNWNRLKYIDPMSGEKHNIFSLAQDPVSQKFIQVITVLDDPENERILVGTDLGLATVSYDTKAVNWLTFDPVLRKSISYLYRDKSQKLWAVISNQIYAIDLAEEKAKPLVFADRITNESYNWITEEPRGVYWIQSTSGIIRYDGEKTSLYANDNFSEGSLKKPAPVANSGGLIYYGGEAGITVISPHLVRKDTMPPRVTVEQIRFPVYNKKGQPKDTSIYAVSGRGLSLDYHQNRLMIKFNALHFKEPTVNQYKYRLLGYENNFTMAGTNAEAYFTNLSPGDYTLEYAAANSDGLWSAIKTIDIIVSPPWYQTWWAWVLYLSFFSLAIYGWIRYRVFMKLEKYKATEEMRTAISADLHDDVGSLLAGLSMKSELMSMGIKPVEVESLNQISQMARDAMERMRDTVWAIDSRKDKVENLLDRMRAFTEQNLPEKGFSYDFKTINIDRSDFINPLIRQNIYLIHKEAVTNILKHSNGNYVEIILEQKTEQFRYRIKDNGTLKNGLSTDGLGMSNIQARARKMQGSLHTLYDEGFVVEVTV